MHAYIHISGVTLILKIGIPIVKDHSSFSKLGSGNIIWLYRTIATSSVMTSILVKNWDTSLASQACGNNESEGQYAI